MAPKAIDARKRIDRNRRFRGHGPLLQKAWAIPTTLGAPQPPVGGAHGPESGSCLDALRPEQSPSRPWAAPTSRTQARTRKHWGHIHTQGSLVPSARAGPSDVFRWQAVRKRTRDRHFSRMSAKVEPANSYWLTTRRSRSWVMFAIARWRCALNSTARCDPLRNFPATLASEWHVPQHCAPRACCCGAPPRGFRMRMCYGVSRRADGVHKTQVRAESRTKEMKK
jgi:hypothetical protein